MKMPFTLANITSAFFVGLVALTATSAHAEIAWKKDLSDHVNLTPVDKVDKATTELDADLRPRNKSSACEDDFSASSSESDSTLAGNPGNTRNEDFQSTKKILLRQVYFDHPQTLYCGFTFDRRTKEVDLPSGFRAPAHQERANRIEWEHVVPAEHFGQAFPEWRDGSGRCINEKGHFYKGRRCADRLSREYRLMQSDMYNLFPAVGAVNAMRSNYPYRMLDGVPSTFGVCEMKVTDRWAEPPERARGRISRAMLYMDAVYHKRYHLSDRQRRLAESWNAQYPVDAWECIRAARIEKLQGNPNPFVKDACLKEGLPYTTRGK